MVGLIAFLNTCCYRRIMEDNTFNRYKETLDPVTLHGINESVTNGDFVIFTKIGRELFGKEFEWFVDLEIDLAEKSDKKRLNEILKRIRVYRDEYERMNARFENDIKIQEMILDNPRNALFPANKDIFLGRVSAFLCMIAAIYIAVIPESIFSVFAWIIYIAGAMTGILHLKRIGEISTGIMYMIWLIPDICAVTRLLFTFFA